MTNANTGPTRHLSMSEVQDLFGDAQDEGLGTNSSQLLVGNLDFQTTMGAQGAGVDDLVGDEVTLVIPVVDQTGSMDDHRDSVIQAFNDMIAALRDSKASDQILVSTWLFNEKPTLLHGYVGLSQVPALTRQNYQPGGLTALFDAVLDAFTGCVAYGQTLRNSGFRTKIIVVAITDGEDNMSRHTISEVRTVADDLLRQEMYVLALVAFGFQGRPVAEQMGFPKVLEANKDASSIRRALGQVSKSIIRKSQTQIASNDADFFS